MTKPVEIADIVVIGSGAGGGTLTKRLTDFGLKVLLIERGHAVPREFDNWNVDKVFNKRQYSPFETWLDRNGNDFRPSTWYNTGGSTKFFGTVMTRLRECDFGELAHAEGMSPAWPFGYSELEPYYCQAERLYGVHGDSSEDPTEPYRSAPLPYGPVGSEPFIADVTERLRRKGLKPFPLPVAVDLHPGGKCIRCRTCDGFPCATGGKNDAETRAVEPALRTGLVTMWKDARAETLVLDGSGRIAAVDVFHEGVLKRVSAKTFILSAGAVNSAALLLRSADRSMPDGLANSSGQVGRNYMTHNLTTVMAVSTKLNPTNFQKTLALNDFYNGDDEYRFPMGNVQTLGKLQSGMLVAGAKYLPQFIGKELTKRSLDLLVTSEDIPEESNRVTLEKDTIRITVRPNNLEAHFRLNRKLRKILNEIGFPLVLSKHLPVNFTAAQCGTIRMGSDPATSALDAFCRSFDHPNLFVVDASFFPSSGAVNPALTIAAQALRVAEHIAVTEYGARDEDARTERIDSAA